VLLVVAAVSAIVLGACGSSTSDGRSLAQQACVHVDRSVTDWVRAGHAGTTNATALSLMSQADQQLRAALPLAAAANSADGTWNALMTTISESESVDEGHLVSALRAQCSAADSNGDVNPATPGSGDGADTGGATGSGGVRTTVPQNVNPKPASSAG
jgi:hypothetical protein